MKKLLLGLLLLSPLAAYPFLRDDRDVCLPPNLNIPNPGPPPLTQDERLVLGSLAFLPGQAFPGAIPWGPLRDIGEQRTKVMDDLARTRPLAFLEHCLEHYKKEVAGYRVLFLKQERVQGKLRPKEKIVAHFREKPFSVHMNWLEGRARAIRTLYVQGENDDKLVARIMFGRFESPLLISRRTDDPEALATSRFTIREFGIFKGAENTVNAMKKAQQIGTLSVRYEGIVPLSQVGERLCYKFVRSPYDPKDWETDLDKEEKLNELTIYIDREMLMQVGSVLKDTEGNLIAEYFFRVIDLNPQFDARQFTQKKL
ncbi:MAG: DUF1571 domain-containing protein [Planctomycetes bacterium]|nr:DUF1571 domain-containing protein [Planctomycetota bacterium]